ncbi:MAG: right-handed parallel beta-helix repeat-containing protein [Thermoplasmata archaeon]|nr:right-handed parallel beta-helix repeat-containing protein [Thermoplasmata archaeon]
MHQNSCVQEWCRCLFTLQKGNPEIVQNTISNNKEGIRITSLGAPAVRNNTIEGNTDYGIYITSNQSFHIEQNNDIGNSTVGIFVGLDGQPTISGNLVRNNDYGIEIQGGNATIHGSNNIHHNDYGIYVNTSHAPDINNNTIEYNNDYGIYIHSASLTYLRIEWNDIENNTDGVGEDYGVYGVPVGEPYWFCECNWWGDNSGPLDDSPIEPLYNPTGQGDRVSDYVDYFRWLKIIDGQKNCTW